jgi:alpha-mannosidase
MRFNARVLSVWVVFLFTVRGGLAAVPARYDRTGPVFRIGEFDRAATGFATGSPKQPVKFIVGESDPTKDWYGTQPAGPISGPEINDVNSPIGPRAIVFHLADAPASAYRLHISLIISSPNIPALLVNINGKHGKFYLQPRLDPSTGANSLYDPANSYADITFPFPGNYLRQGANTITFRAAEETANPAAGAALIFDAIELDTDPLGTRASASSAQILPTIFYQQRNGQLEETIDVILRECEPAKPGGTADLVIAGKQNHQALTGGQDFGDEKLEFTVPEFPAQTRARLTWISGNHKRHLEELIDPEKKWTFFLVPHIHLDIGYTDYQAKVAAVQSRVIDEAMDLTAQHPGFTFSIDGEWSLEQFQKTRTPAEQQRALTAMQKHQLFVPAQYANLLTGFPTAETLIRSLYASANFSRIHGTPFNYANITDVPSYSWSYASILAAAGIKYLIAGTNYHNYRAPVLPIGHLNEDAPFWWQGPDGQKVLFWYSRGYCLMQHLFGLPPALSAVYDTLPVFVQQYQHPSYRANAAIIYGTQPENTDLFPQQAELAQQWNSMHVYPRLEYSGFYEALTSIQQQFRNDDLPTIKGDGGPYWEDGIASDAFYAALERRNESRGPSAEKLSTLTAVVNPRLAADKTDLDRMWQDMLLMDEHTWTSAISIGDPTSMEAVKQLAVKNSYATNAEALSDFLIRNSMASLVDSITAGRGSVVVFNTLNWTRDGMVTIDLNKSTEIVDALTGRVVPYEVIGTGNQLLHVRFIARDVPAIGYEVFQLRHAEPQAIPKAITPTTVLESPYYRVALDPSTGAVRSIYDKQLQRELVNQQSPYHFCEYLYVTGGNQEPNSILDSRMVLPKPDLQIHPAHDGRLVSVTPTPFGSVARIESSDTNTPAIETEIRLFDHAKKIEFVEDVTKKEVDSKEAVYFAFPFAMDHPQFQYEIQTGVVDPAKDMYPGAGHEWFSAQHWVSIQQGGMSATVMPLDASLVTLGDINRGAWRSQFGDRQGTIFSYVMNNYWFTNYRAGQGGHFRFRYVITSAPSTDAAQLSRMGWEEVTPLEKDEVTSQDRAMNLPRPLSGKQDSFLQVNDRNVLLETWKPAEDGNGTVLRFLDLGGRVRTVTIQIPLLQLQQAWQTDAVERNLKSLSLVGPKGFEVTIHPNEIVTVRIVGKNTL